MNNQSTPARSEDSELLGELSGALNSGQIERELKRQMTRRAFIKRTTRAGIAVLGAGSAWHWATKIEPRWIETRRVQLSIPHLYPAFDGWTLAQISDIHVNEWMTQPRLQHIVGKVNALRPDIIAITGDFVSRRQPGHDRVLTEVLNTLKPRREAFAVMGNHDHWSNVKFVRNAIRKSGVQELQNSFHTFAKDGGVLHLCGLDDAWVGAADAPELLRKMPAKGAAILLAHEPDFADDYAKAKRFDVQLAGHSHGGQVQIPLIGPIHLPRYGQKYNDGRYRIASTQGARALTLYVNRGVGMVKPFVRFACRPEITLFTLRRGTKF